MELSDLDLDTEFINRLLELYTVEELLEFSDLEPAEALALLVRYGAIDFDDVPA